MQRSATQSETSRRDDVSEVVSWRFETLRQAGYPDGEAVVLATASRVDLHHACDLLARGCPAPTAVEILL